MKDLPLLCKGKNSLSQISYICAYKTCIYAFLLFFFFFLSGLCNSIFACLIIQQHINLKLTQETMQHQGLITSYASGKLLGHSKCSHSKVDKVFAGETSHGNSEMPIIHHEGFLFFPNNSLGLLGKLLYLSRASWGQIEMLWSSKRKHDVSSTFPTQSTKEGHLHSSPVNHPHQSERHRTALHSFKPGCVCISH